MLLVLPGQASSGGVSWGSGSVMTLTPDDADAIAHEAPDAQYVAPLVRGKGQIIYGNRNWVPMQIAGTSPEFLTVRSWTIEQGDCFTDRDVRNANKVCVIGQTLKRELFGALDPIGEELRVQNVSFRVVGVLAPNGRQHDGYGPGRHTDCALDHYQVSNLGSRRQRRAGCGIILVGNFDAGDSLSELYPSSSVKLYPEISAVQAADTPLPVRFTNVDQILVSAKSSTGIPAAMNQINQLLRERHHLRGG